MNTIFDPRGNPTVLVDQMIGQAYPTVRFVAENMEYIKHVSYYLPQIYEVNNVLSNISAVLDNLVLLNTISNNLTVINTVEDNISNINTVALNISAILNLNSNIAQISQAAIDAQLAAIAAETAQAAAELARDAALAAGVTEFASTVSDIKLLNTDEHIHVFLTDTSRFGSFELLFGDFSTYVTQDTREAVYIKPNDKSASVACWVRVGADWRNKSHKKLHLNWFGWVADGVTDNTDAANAAIDIANISGNTGIILPVGISCVGLLNRIKKGDVYFDAEITGSSTLKGTDTAGMLRWGDPAETIFAGGGCNGIKFEGNGNVAQSLILVVWAGELKFSDCILWEGVAGWMKLGAATGGNDYCGTMYIDNLTGRVPNVNAAVIEYINGAGLFFTNINVYNQAAHGGALLGRHFLLGYQGSWNTISIRNSFIYLFRTTLTADVQSGKLLGDVHMTDCYFDEMGEGIVLIAQAGAGIGSVILDHLQLTGKNGSAIVLNGNGQFLQVEMKNLTIRETKKYGIAVYSPILLGKIKDVTITQANEPCNFTGSISGTTLTVTAMGAGAPGGTLAVNDIISGTGVTPGTTIVSIDSGVGLVGTYTVSASQTVASTAMQTATGNYASLYMADGSENVIITGNSFGRGSTSLGPGQGAYGAIIDGGTDLIIKDNQATGLIADWVIGELINSECDLWLPWVPVLSSTGGADFTAATVTSATYQRVNNTVHYSIQGTITTVGSATGFITFTLPANVSDDISMEWVSAGVFAGASVNAIATSSGNLAYIVKYDGSSTATTTGNFSITGQYRV